MQHQIDHDGGDSMAAAKSVKERVASYRAQLREQGGKQITVYLDKETADKLDELTEETGGEMSAIIKDAIQLLHKEELGTK